MIYLNRLFVLFAFLLVVTAPASSAENRESFAKFNDIRVLTFACKGDEALVSSRLDLQRSSASSDERLSRSKNLSRRSRWARTKRSRTLLTPWSILPLPSSVLRDAHNKTERSSLVTAWGHRSAKVLIGYSGKDSW